MNPIKQVRNKDGLTTKEERFVHEFLTDFNAMGAARRAGYAENAAKQTGYRLLNEPNINRIIKREREQMVKKYQVSRETIVTELCKIAFTDPRNFFDEFGNMKEMHELDDITVGSIMSIEVEELFTGSGDNRVKIGMTKKLNRWDKIKALDVLCKVFGYYAPVKIDNVAPPPMSDEQFDKLLIAARETKADTSK